MHIKKPLSDILTHDRVTVNIQSRNFTNILNVLT